MSTIAGASNTIDWLSSAWADIKSQSANATGIPVLDAASATAKGRRGGQSVAESEALASQLESIEDNLVQQQGMLAGQAALTRVQDEVKSEQTAAASTSDTNDDADTGTSSPVAQDDLLAQIDGFAEPGSIVDTTA